MKRSPIMNLKTGLKFCPVCHHQYAWDIQVCPVCTTRKEVAAAATQAEIERQQYIYDQLAAVKQAWSTDEAKAAQKAEGEVTAAELARDMTDDFCAYFDSIYGAETRESMRDWQDMRGDCAV